MTEKIRTNKQFFGALFRKGLDKIPRAKDGSALGELLNHVTDSAKEELDRMPGDKKAIDVPSEEPDNAGP